jgi:hypothetical protein
MFVNSQSWLCNCHGSREYWEWETSQKILLFIVTAMRTSNPTMWRNCNFCNINYKANKHKLTSSLSSDCKKNTGGVALSRNQQYTLQYLNQLGSHDVFLLLFVFSGSTVVLNLFTFFCITWAKIPLSRQDKSVYNVMYRLPES